MADTEPATPPDPFESLRARLAAAPDDGTRAGLLHAIGVELSRRGRSEDALAATIEAAGIRARLADLDESAAPLLAASLVNCGVLLRGLGRFDHALGYHATAHTILSGHRSASAEAERHFGLNAAGCADAFAQLEVLDMAVRFQGMAVEAFVEGARLGDDSCRREIGPAMTVLARCLDQLGEPTLKAPDPVPEAHLLLPLTHGSLEVATALLEATQRRYRQDEASDALVAHVDGTADQWGWRTYRYCDLVATEDPRFTELARQAAQLVLERPGPTIVGPRLALESTVKAWDQPTRGATDRRLWCCSARDLLHILRDLSRAGIPAGDVHTLAQGLRERGIYPARDYAHRCQPRLPDVFVTHDWRHGFHDLHRQIHGMLVYLGQLLYQRDRAVPAERVRHLMFTEIGFWIDFVFIDQSGRDLAAEVRQILPQAIASSQLHFVLTDSALQRTWCCYEMALFNLPRQSAATTAPGGAAWAAAVPPAPSMRSFLVPPRLDYRGFDATGTSQPEDKDAIRASLREGFENAIAEVDLLLLQASLLGDRHGTAAYAQYSGAEALAEAAVARWLAERGEAWQPTE